MIQEAAQTYPGVLCSHCKATTPVSSKTARLYEELKQVNPDDSKPRAFTLRCKACNSEGVYDVKVIQEFEGTPRKRASPITNQTLKRRHTRSVDAVKTREEVMNRRDQSTKE